MSSQTKIVTITLAAGVGNFVFSKGPTPVKTAYEEGETVGVEYCIKNNGEVTSDAAIEIKDLDTDKVLQNYKVLALDPGWQWCSNPPYHIHVGTMPNRNWRLQFKVTP